MHGATLHLLCAPRPGLRCVRKPSLQGMMSLHLTHAGIPRLQETLDELQECHRQICSESVRKHTRLLEILHAREDELCSTIVCIASKGECSNGFSLRLSVPAECILAEDAIQTLCLPIVAALIVNAEVPEADHIIDQLVDCDRILAELEKPLSPWTAGQAAEVSPAIAAPEPGETCSIYAQMMHRVRIDLDARQPDGRLASDLLYQMGARSRLLVIRVVKNVAGIPAFNLVQPSLSLVASVTERPRTQLYLHSKRGPGCCCAPQSKGGSA